MSLIVAAAAVPFVLLVAAVIVLASVRYTVGAGVLRVSVFGVLVRRIPLTDINSVEYVPPEKAGRWNPLHHGGSVILSVGRKTPRTFILSPRDAEGLARDLEEMVKPFSG